HRLHEVGDREPLAAARKRPAQPGHESVEVAPHDLRAEDAVGSGAGVDRPCQILLVALEPAGVVAGFDVLDRAAGAEDVEDLGVAGALEVLLRTAGEPRPRSELEVLLGAPGDPRARE